MNLKDIFFIGNNIIYLNEPYKIEFIDFIKPGKGHEFIRTKIRNWITNKLITKTFKFFSNIKKANIYIDKYLYIYNLKNYWYFLNKCNYHQISLSKKIVNKYISLIFINNFYKIVFWNNNPINIILPKYVILKVIKIYFDKKDYSFSNIKYVKLVTGLKIKVPNFINIGDIIKIDTKYFSYKSRVNNFNYI